MKPGGLMAQAITADQTSRHATADLTPRATSRRAASDRESISDAGIGLDVPGTFFRLDLSPQLRDVRAQHLRIVAMRRAPHRDQKLTVCDQPAAVAHKHAQQLAPVGEIDPTWRQRTTGERPNNQSAT